MKKTLIFNAKLVNEGHTFKGSLLINDDRIESVFTTPDVSLSDKDITYIDAKGAYLIPGAIDEHVHFRDPGLTEKADMHTESKAAAAGGITSIMDMPNVEPLTITIENLEERFTIAKNKCLVNYSFYFGATNNNVELLSKLDPKRICGVKLFMGSSTGNMLVDETDKLYQIFKQSPLLIATHCEDPKRIKENSNRIRETYGKEASIDFHPIIRDEMACYNSSQRAVQLARKTGARLHLLHITTEKELSLLQSEPIEEKKITAEVCIPHLLFHEKDYQHYGAKIKCNPAIKDIHHREALRKALQQNIIDTIATDHAPHLLEDKQGGCFQAASGMPMIQFSLISMLDLAQKENWAIHTIVEKMCHAPSKLFKIKDRGYLRPGYKADLVLVKKVTPWELQKKDILSKCAWSPLEGKTFNHRIEKTFINGHLIYNKGKFTSDLYSEELVFETK